MNKTAENDIPLNGRIMVTTPELQQLLSCGRDTAVKIGIAAEAKRKIGSSVLWNVQRVREYTYQMNEQYSN